VKCVCVWGVVVGFRVLRLELQGLGYMVVRVKV